MFKIDLFLTVNLRGILFIILFIFFSYSNCFSQEVFHKTIGSSQNDFGSLFKVKHGYYLVGYSTANGSEDMYIVHLDKNLKVLWSKLYGTNAGDRAMEIIQKSDGNLLISGWGNSASSTALLEIDSTGNIISTTGFGILHDRLHKIIKTIDGGYLNYGELEGLVPGHNKVAMIKYDAVMNIKWKKYYDNTTSSDNNSSFEVYGRRAVQLEDNGFAILGSYTELYAPFDIRKIRVIRVDNNGNEIWTRGFHGGRMDDAQHMILCNDGGFLISATSNSYSNDTEILLIKTDKDGALEWTKTYGGSEDESAGQLLQLDNGNYMISGTTASFGAKGKDFLLFEVNDKGTLLKAHIYGGEKDDILLKIEKESDFFLLSGSTNSFEQPDNNIYIVKTEFKESTTDCSKDVSSSVNVKEVNSSFFNEHYAPGDFISPTALYLNTSTIQSHEIEPCSDCPAGKNESYLLCPNESRLIDYSSVTKNAVKWEDGSVEMAREIYNEGVYWVEYQIGLCVIRDSLIFSKESDIDLGQNKIICPDEQILLDASIPKGLSYLWQDNSTNASHSVSKAGVYNVKILTDNCVLQDTIEFKEYVNYKLDLGEDKIICYDETVVFDASLQGAITYKWLDGNTNSIYETSEPGWYKVVVSTACEVISDSVEIKYPMKKDFFIPNVITPNGDKFNDKFEISATDLQVHLTILNRWGKEVFMDDSYANDWNGGNLPSGIYFYLVEIGCTNQEYKGWVQILRD